MDVKRLAAALVIGGLAAAVPAGPAHAERANIAVACDGFDLSPHPQFPDTRLVGTGVCAVVRQGGQVSDRYFDPDPTQGDLTASTVVDLELRFAAESMVCSGTGTASTDDAMVFVKVHEAGARLPDGSRADLSFQVLESSFKSVAGAGKAEFGIEGHELPPTNDPFRGAVAVTGAFEHSGSCPGGSWVGDWTLGDPVFDETTASLPS